MVTVLLTRGWAFDRRHANKLWNRPWRRSTRLGKTRALSVLPSEGREPSFSGNKRRAEEESLQEDDANEVKRGLQVNGGVGLWSALEPWSLETWPLETWRSRGQNQAESSLPGGQRRPQL